MELLNNDFQNLILKLSKKLPYCHISGSVALYLTGFLNRKINDIDICIPIQHQYKVIKYINLKKYGILFSWLFNFRKPKPHYKYKINNIKICVFFTNEQQCLIVPFNNTKIKLSLPESIIEIKTKYIEKKLKFDRSFIEKHDFGYESDNIEKHGEDIKYYIKNKNSIDRLYKTKLILDIYKIHDF